MSISQNQGHLIYALDDSYIHMSMAKNFAQYGIWGVDRYGFSSSSSSLLWTLLLSLIYFLFGANEITPFILNFIFGTSLVLGIYFILKKHLSHSLSLFFILLSIIFFTPLPSLIFSGLEHTMHAVISLFFIYLSAKILSDNKPTSLKYQLLILAPLLTMARFEGLFLVFVVCVLFLIRKKFVYSFLLGALALVPIIIYGAISTTNGWFFLPNSILLKGNMPALSINEISNFFYHFYSQLTDNYHILILLLACLVVFFVQPNKKQAFWKLPTMMTVIYIATTILHMLFAQSGWFFRYEAYLVALGIFVLAIGLSEYLPKKLLFVLEIKLIPKYIATAFLILLLFLALNVRGVVSLVEIPRATTNI
ncbi:MAG: hypothetical protein NTU97_03450 [Candidatus Magasanikbacteria bacterium]|nr:hypothetical protein [Candidatus Magasanikbacteria bacterium]